MIVFVCYLVGSYFQHVLFPVKYHLSNFLHVFLSLSKQLFFFISQASGIDEVRQFLFRVYFYILDILQLDTFDTQFSVLFLNPFEGILVAAKWLNHQQEAVHYRNVIHLVV